MKKTIKYLTYESDPAELATSKVQKNISLQLIEDQRYELNKHSISKVVNKLYEILYEISEQVIWKDRYCNIQTVFGKRREPRERYLSDAHFERRKEECKHVFRIINHRIVTQLRHGEICFTLYRGEYGLLPSHDIIKDNLTLEDLIEAVTDIVAEYATAKFNKEIIKGA